MIGASNGTTAMIDYMAWAQSEPTAVPVAAMGFMTGGTYTEAQTSPATYTNASPS